MGEGLSVGGNELKRDEDRGELLNSLSRGRLFSLKRILQYLVSVEIEDIAMSVLSISCTSGENNKKTEGGRGEKRNRACRDTHTVHVFEHAAHMQ